MSQSEIFHQKNYIEQSQDEGKTNYLQKEEVGQDLDLDQFDIERNKTDTVNGDYEE